MGDVVHIIDDAIIPDIATDDGAVIQSYRSAEVVEFKIELFELSDPYQSIELTVLYQFRSECIRYENIIPVVGCVSVAYQDFNLIGR
jgi:hypothetical protein